MLACSWGEVDSSEKNFHSKTELWPAGYATIWPDEQSGATFVSRISSSGDGADAKPVFSVLLRPKDEEDEQVGAGL